MSWKIAEYSIKISPFTFYIFLQPFRFIEFTSLANITIRFRVNEYPVVLFDVHYKMLGSKGILPPMIHGLLRISCSRNPKTPQIRSFFYEKWLLFGVLQVNKSCFFMQAWNAWPFDLCIIIMYMISDVDGFLDIFTKQGTCLIRVYADKKTSGQMNSART